MMYKITPSLLAKFNRFKLIVSRKVVHDFRNNEWLPQKIGESIGLVQSDDLDTNELIPKIMLRRVDAKPAESVQLAPKNLKRLKKPTSKKNTQKQSNTKKAKQKPAKSKRPMFILNTPSNKSSKSKNN